MKIYKKLLISLLLITMLITLTGCSKKSNVKENNDQTIDPAATIVFNEIKSDPIVAKVNAADQGSNEKTVEIHIKGNDDNAAAVSKLRSYADKLKVVYPNNKITVKLIRDGDFFATLNR